MKPAMDGMVRRRQPASWQAVAGVANPPRGERYAIGSPRRRVLMAGLFWVARGAGEGEAACDRVGTGVPVGARDGACEGAGFWRCGVPGGGKRQRRVARADWTGLWVRAGDRPQGLGPGKGDEQLGYGQKQLPVRVEPSGGVAVVAPGTMAMLAGMGAVLEFLAICALVDMTAKGLGTTRLNSRPGGQVAGGPRVAASGAVRRSMAPADVGQRDHRGPRPTRRGRSGVP